MKSDNIGIIINDKEGDYGYASCWKSEEESDINKYRAEIYQSRFSKELLLSDEFFESEELADSKCYTEETVDMLEAINKVLAFWFIETINAKTLESLLKDADIDLNTAVKELEKKDMKFILVGE